MYSNLNPSLTVPFLIDCFALIPYIIYFKRKFLFIKTNLLSILYFSKSTKSSAKSHCLLTYLGCFHLLFCSSSSWPFLCPWTLVLFFFLYLFVFLPKLLHLETKFKVVEIQPGYIGEKEGISLIYLKLGENTKINLDWISTNQNMFTSSWSVFQIGLSKLSCRFVLNHDCSLWW